MNLKIIQNEDKITINFNKEILEIFTKEEDQAKNILWNTNGINNFLIKLSASLPKDEQIDVIADKDSTNKIYNHIVALFEEFATSYKENIS